LQMAAMVGSELILLTSVRIKLSSHVKPASAQHPFVIKELFRNDCPKIVPKPSLGRFCVLCGAPKKKGQG
ncbi:hypothetical protein RM530_16220, partial [Algiphilus sp. W345]